MIESMGSRNDQSEDKGTKLEDRTKISDHLMRHTLKRNMKNGSNNSEMTQRGLM